MSLALSTSPHSRASVIRSAAHIALLVAVAVVALASAPHAAAAQDERATAAARGLFREGLAMIDSGRWDAARDRFERALAMHRSSVIAFNLGTVCVHLGRFVEATELYEEVRRDETAPAAAREAAERELAVLRPKLGRLVVRVAGRIDGIAIRLDGEPLAAALVGVPIPADPGTHEADAVRDGTSIARASVSLLAGASAELTLRLPAVLLGAAEVARHDGAERAARPARSRPASNDDVTWVLVGVSVTAVVIAAAIVVAYVLLESTGPAEWPGDTSPGVLRW